MNLKSLLTSKTINAMLFVFACVLTQVDAAHAQGMRNSSYRYIGFEANFGVKSSQISSDLPAINNMKLAEEGGSIGLVMGNQVVKGRMQVAGFYSQSRLNTQSTEGVS